MLIENIAYKYNFLLNMIFTFKNISIFAVCLQNDDSVNLTYKMADLSKNLILHL